MLTNIQLSNQTDMLGYRHGFHAGNFADVLKHLVLANSLAYLTRKSRPLLYIDTHAGAGRYHLLGEMAQKTGEAEAGILHLDFARLTDELTTELKPSIGVFERLIKSYLASQQYPGSPAIAAQMLRQQDRLALFELHPADFADLSDEFAMDSRVACNQSDGFHSAKSLLPAREKKAIVLIDPSYEIKDDYQMVVDYLVTAWRRAATGHFLLWYPIIQRATTERMIQNISKSGVRDLWRFELGIADDSVEYGMTGCGMLAINPPWILPQQLQQLLPAVQKQLARESGSWKVECLVAE
jgi:23S rRNA (adenine2030-N6)-methyltransferase